MQHQGTKTIETHRLILRRFKPEDAQAVYQNWASDPEVTRYLTWPAHADAQVSARVLEEWVRSYEKSDFYQWAIVLKEGGPDPIGSIAVVHQNEAVAMAHVGYCIGRAWWRRGVMSEALQAVMDFLFDAVGVNRVESRHDPRNENSGKVMLKCGMRYEGTMRQADRNNQGVCDVSYYALLASDRKRDA